MRGRGGHIDRKSRIGGGVASIRKAFAVSNTEMDNNERSDNIMLLLTTVQYPIKYIVQWSLMTECYNE